MSIETQSKVRVVLVGGGHAFSQACAMASDAGARVSVAVDAAGALDLLRQSGGDLVLIDIQAGVPAFIAQLRRERMSVPVIACGIDASPQQAVAAIRGGAVDFLPLPPQHDLIAAAIHSVANRQATMLGDNPAFLRAVHFAQAMAPSAAPLLIMGEMATGKEMLARVVHQVSRRDGDFVTIDCAGVDDDILLSELFGHEPGAFTDAVASRAGCLEQARGGTLFLRNADALSGKLQQQLLTALQLSTYRRIGGGDSLPLETRFIISSRAALLSIQGFRADLAARLSLVEVTLPALRNRGGDIAAIAKAIISGIARDHGTLDRPLTPAALDLLTRHSWPGNFRELTQMLQRAAVTATGSMIEADDLVLADGSLLGALIEPGAAMTIDSFVGRTVADVERDLILSTLESCHGNRTSASTILGISVRTMRNKLKSFIEAGIPVAPSH